MNTNTHSQLASFIWKICNLLRGTYKRNEYRKVILPLTVLRRFDCVLADTKEAVLAAVKQHAHRPDTVRRLLLEAASGRPFYNTSKLDFERLLDDPNLLAQNLNAYIRGFSENVHEIIEHFGFADHIARMDEQNLLFEVVKAFAAVDLSPERVDNMQMGYVFEELIRIGAEQSNEEAGEHFTPREVIRLMVSLLLSPEPDLGKSHVVKTIYDPACGTGGMLSVTEDHLLGHNRVPLSAFCEQPRRGHRRSDIPTPSRAHHPASNPAWHRHIQRRLVMHQQPGQPRKRRPGRVGGLKHTVCAIGTGHVCQFRQAV